MNKNKKELYFTKKIELPKNQKCQNKQFFKQKINYKLIIICKYRNLIHFRECPATNEQNIFCLFL